MIKKLVQRYAHFSKELILTYTDIDRHIYG